MLINFFMHFMELILKKIYFWNSKRVEKYVKFRLRLLGGLHRAQRPRETACGVAQGVAGRRAQGFLRDARLWRAHHALVGQGV